MKISVLILSDRASKGVYQDLSGPAAVEEIKRWFAAENKKVDSILVKVIPDSRAVLLKELKRCSSSDWILTSGGTGVGPRDITPDVCARFAKKTIPGVGEYLRSISLQETRNAPLSRIYCGVRKKTVVLCLPGSPKAVRSLVPKSLPLLMHASAMIAGEGH